MKNTITIFAISLFSVVSLKAQITEQYTMWNLNHFLVNPAAAGNSDYLDVSLGFRRQWAGVSDAPSTFYGTGHTVLNGPKISERSAIRISNSSTSKAKPRLKHAVGAKLGTIENGAFRKSEGLLTYALHLPILNDMYLSFGVSAGMSNLGFAESKAEVLRDADRTYEAYAAGRNQNMFNVNAGTYLYSDKFYIGYSASDLMQNKLDLIETTASLNERSQLKIRHQIIGGYHFDLNNDFRISPAVLIKQSGVSPISYDINTNVTYKQCISLGAAYRSEDAISALLGFKFNHLLKAGYAYDFSLSDIREQSSGSHEIFIGITLF
jgi:type IX secretion system PorP/SprF family membrane protein